MCLPIWVYTLPCGTPEIKNGVKTGRIGGLKCVCTDHTNGGTVTGGCVAPIDCKGMSASGLDGKSSSIGGDAMSQLLKAAGDILGKIMGGGGGGGSGSGGGSGDPGTGPNGNCPTMTTVSDPALLNGNPCVTYVPPITQTCNLPGQTYSVSSGGCVCPVGQTATLVGCSPAGITNCSISGQTFSTLTNSCSCPIGQILSSDGLSCTTGSGLTNCPLPGQVFSTSTNSCITPTCTVSGQTYSTDTNSCLCPTSTTLSSDGLRCVSASVNNCSVNGQSFATSSGRCICPPGKTISPDGTSCVVLINKTTADVTGTFIIVGSSTNGSNGSKVPQLGFNQGNTTGYIDENGNSGTLVARTYDQSTNSETAGFYGADTYGNGVSAMVGGWCRTRPWANNFLGQLFSTTFFDGMCQWAGYNVGSIQVVNAPAPSSGRSTVRTVPKTPAKPAVEPIATSTPLIPARVDIWAVPPKVSLGARTTIFWNTQAVTNCTESSPDGSFHQTTLAGGGSTVPLTGATTYTISCLDYQQNPVTDFVTVQIGQ
jgi:hypothetical protein